MPRELTSHRVNGLNEALRIEVLDEPGNGGACHEYRIVPIELGTIPAECGIEERIGTFIGFQNGPIKEAGVNGISNEALLAIVEDRLVGFQSGEYACDRNASALFYVQNAMDHLAQRTLERVVRGVEGTNKK